MARTSRTGAVVLAALALVGVLLALTADPARAGTFSVNSTGDASDADLSDTECNTTVGATGGVCTLRAAIQEANATAGLDAIEFNIQRFSK